MRRDCCACSPGLASSWQSHHASLAFSLPTSTLRILVERFSTLSLSCVCFSARSLSLLAASNKGAVEPRLWFPLTFCEPEQQRKCRTKKQATRAKKDQGRMRRVGRHPAKEKSAGAGGKMLLYSHCAVVWKQYVHTWIASGKHHGTIDAQQRKTSPARPSPRIRTRQYVDVFLVLGIS